MRAAIVILNWNGREFLRKYLPDVISELPPECGVVVADNGSTDGSVEMLETEFAGKCSIIRMDKNYGFTGGYNRALKRVEAEYYVIMNSDIRVPRSESNRNSNSNSKAEGNKECGSRTCSGNWLESLLLFMEEHPQAGICMPKILSEPEKMAGNGEIFEYAGACGGFLDRYGFPFCRGRILSSLERDNNQYSNPMEIFWASGACMVIRSSLFHQLGGFDECFFAHMEEIDLCWRAKLQGQQVWVAPQSHVYHVGGGTLPNNSPRKLYLNYRNNLLMLYKNLPIKGESWRPFGRGALLGRAFGRNCHIFQRMCIDGLSAAAYLLQGKFSYFNAVWRAHRDFFKMRRTIQLSPRREGAYEKGFSGLYKGSIIVAFFSGRKRFSRLKWR